MSVPCQPVPSSLWMRHIGWAYRPVWHCRIVCGADVCACAHLSLYLSVSWATITLELPLAYVRLVGYPSLTCSAIGRLSEHSKPTRLSTPHALSRSFNSSNNIGMWCTILSNLNGQISEIQAQPNCATSCGPQHNCATTLHSVTAVHCFSLRTTQPALQWSCN